MSPGPEPGPGPGQGPDPLPDPGPEHPSRHSEGHGALRSLLGGWALDACSPEEAKAVDSHLDECAACAGEARRLRDAVQWLSPPDPLDLGPLLRAQVLEDCLTRRPAEVPVPPWIAPYAAETFRLDALLGSLSPSEWDTTVELVWHEGTRRMTLCGVLAHLGSIDGLVGAALDLPDPLGPGAPHAMSARTDTAAERCRSHTPEFVRNKWRSQTHALVRTGAVAGESSAAMSVDFGGAFKLPLRDAFLDRAFECWIHSADIAKAVDYPHGDPEPEHLHAMIDFTLRILPFAIAERRRLGLAKSVARLGAVGAPGRSIHIQIEGPGGGDWYVPLDSPAATASASTSVAHIALDRFEYCRLAAGHTDPDPGQLAVGIEGDKTVVNDVLYAAASLSRP